MDWRTFLTIGHIIGTVLGVGGATFAEIFIQKSLKDGKVDETENQFLHTTYFVLRLGLVILVLSGIGYFLLALQTGTTARFLGPRVLAKMTITGIIVLNAILLKIRKVPLWLGSGISLTSWYAALVIGAWRVKADYPTLIFWYIIAIGVVTVILKLIREGKLWIKK